MSQLVSHNEDSHDDSTNEVKQQSDSNVLQFQSSHVFKKQSYIDDSSKLLNIYGIRSIPEWIDYMNKHLNEQPYTVQRLLYLGFKTYPESLLQIHELQITNVIKSHNEYYKIDLDASQIFKELNKDYKYMYSSIYVTKHLKIIL